MIDEAAAYELDSYAVRRAFDRAASSFDAAAVLHGEVRTNLLERLSLTALEPSVILDAGAGTGQGSRELRARYPKALVVALDLSPAMLKVATRQQSWRRPFVRVCADAQRLPFAEGAVDLVLSNLMLPWCNPDAAFAEFRRILAPRGLLTFTSLGPDTLRELRSAWSRADSHTHVNQFIDMHDIGDALVRAGFASPVLDVERYSLVYSDVRRLAADLKATGAGNRTAGRARGLTGRGKFAAMGAAYEEFRQDGRLPASYEVVFGHAWAPTAGPRRGTGDVTQVSLEELKRELKSRRRT